jgi:hypothetical protein
MSIIIMLSYVDMSIMILLASVDISIMIMLTTVDNNYAGISSSVDHNCASFIVLRKSYIGVFIRFYNPLKYNCCQKITY